MADDPPYSELNDGDRSTRIRKWAADLEKSARSKESSETDPIVATQLLLAAIEQGSSPIADRPGTLRQLQDATVSYIYRYNAVDKEWAKTSISEVTAILKDCTNAIRDEQKKTAKDDNSRRESDNSGGKPQGGGTEDVKDHDRVTSNRYALLGAALTSVGADLRRAAALKRKVAVVLSQVRPLAGLKIATSDKTAAAAEAAKSGWGSEFNRDF